MEHIRELVAAYTSDIRGRDIKINLQAGEIAQLRAKLKAAEENILCLLNENDDLCKLLRQTTAKRRRVLRKPNGSTIIDLTHDLSD